MSLKPSPIPAVPEETARIASAAFRKGNIYLKMRDELGVIYEDELFAPLYPARGQPAAAPWRLALVCILQFAEGLTDRQAADAVRGRLDWKYLLGLALADPGFDFSVLSEFRSRLLAGGLEQQLLDVMLTHFKSHGWLKARGKQRTDSTHVLAAIRTLNRLETVGETLRAALNALAVVAPEWVRAQVTPAWFDRYSLRIEEYRLPQGKEARQAYAQTIGDDGFHLLTAIYANAAPAWLRQVPAVEILRQVWLQQYVVSEGALRLRTAEELPPAGTRIESPYDAEARYAIKRNTTWSGYKVHVTESCDADGPYLITHVETTQASIQDADMAAPIQGALAEKELLPGEHLLDAGYVDAEFLVTSQTEQGVTVVGPVRPDISWQAQDDQAYDLSAFTIDWKAQQVTCPGGKTSSSWCPHDDQWNNPVIAVKFSRTDCRTCPLRSRCTKAKTEPRHLTLRPQAEHDALQTARAHQKTPEWQARYAKRAGIEGTLSQGIRTFELRETRYIGLAKTHLQHLLTAAAINIVRLMDWLQDPRRSTTRPSRFGALALAAT
jgi:transposase